MLWHSALGAKAFNSAPGSVDEVRSSATPRSLSTLIYNCDWLIERLGYRTPREASNEATVLVAA